MVERPALLLLLDVMLVYTDDVVYDELVDVRLVVADIIVVQLEVKLSNSDSVLYEKLEPSTLPDSGSLIDAPLEAMP